MSASAPTVEQLRRDLVEVARRMHSAGLVAATDGNVSARVGAAHLLVTRTATPKNRLGPEDVLLLDLEGRVLEGSGRPSSELAMHLACYEERPEIRAVVHAHPPHAVALTLAGRSLAAPILPEIVVTLGGIPTVPYATPTTPDAARSVRPFAARCDAFLLASHGAVCLGSDLRDAWDKLEKLEHCARILHLAEQVGGARRLPEDEVRRLLRLREELGLSGPNWLLDGLDSEGSAGR